MAGDKVPHFHNEIGVRSISIGAREFMCMGAKPPMDHPHVFLDVGDEGEIVCPYCSTLFLYDAKIGSGDAVPPDCVYKEYGLNPVG